MRNAGQHQRTILALTLARLYGYGSNAVNAILQQVEAPEDLEKIRQQISSFNLPGDILTAAECALSESVLAKCERYDIQAFAFGDVDYPPMLAQIPKAPAVLFVRGRWLGNQALPGIAIVGSREATPNGKRIAQRLAQHFGGLGWPIISGLALGIDAAAHEGALSANSYTIAVLAHGLHKASPKANAGLADRILDSGGAWASEYPPGVEPRKENFVARNRIQSGLSAGSIIVEGARSSGTMTQAQYSLGQRRKLFAVVPLEPSNPLHLNCEGPSSLVESGQASPIRSSADYPKVLEGLEASKLRLAAPAQSI